MPEADGPVAILAGSGALPLQAMQALDAAGRKRRILAFRGFADADLRAEADAVVDLLDVSGSLECLDAWRPDAVVLAGGIQRPKLSAVLGAFSAVRNQREIRALMARGDDQLLRGVLSILEERGHRVIGVHEVAPGLLAKPGRLGRIDPTAEDSQSIASGVKLLAALSPFDIGQATVVSGERVLAVEGPEGTDRTLQRVGRLGRGWRLRRTPSQGVLVKAAKRGQDLRVDMPVIGPRTVREAARAGLRGVAVGAGSTLIIDQDATIALADRLGLFLVGVMLPWAEEGS